MRYSRARRANGFHVSCDASGFPGATLGPDDYVEQVDADGGQLPTQSMEHLGITLVDCRGRMEVIGPGIDDHPAVGAPAVAQAFEVGVVERFGVVGPRLDRVHARTLEVAVEPAVFAQVPDLGPGLPTEGVVDPGVSATKSSASLNWTDS